MLAGQQIPQSQISKSLGRIPTNEPHEQTMTFRSLPAAILIAMLTACNAPAEQQSTGLTFIHLNDTYRIGAVEDGNAGGFGRVVTIIRELQAEGRDVRILHGGDFLYPSLESQLWHGEQMVDAFIFMDAIA